MKSYANEKSLARPLLHDTPRQPLTQVNGYNGRNVYRIEQHLKLQCGAGLNGQSLKDGPKQRHRDGIAEFTQGHKNVLPGLYITFENFHTLEKLLPAA